MSLENIYKNLSKDEIIENIKTKKYNWTYILKYSDNFNEELYNKINIIDYRINKYISRCEYITKDIIYKYKYIKFDLQFLYDKGILNIEDLNNLYNKYYSYLNISLEDFLQNDINFEFCTYNISNQINKETYIKYHYKKWDLYTICNRDWFDKEVFEMFYEKRWNMSNISRKDWVDKELVLKYNTLNWDIDYLQNTQIFDKEVLFCFIHSIKNIKQITKKLSLTKQDIYFIIEKNNEIILDWKYICRQDYFDKEMIEFFSSKDLDWKYLYFNKIF